MSDLAAQYCRRMNRMNILNRVFSPSATEDMPRIGEIYYDRYATTSTKTHHLSDRDDEFSAASDNASACMMCAVQINRHAPSCTRQSVAAVAVSCATTQLQWRGYVAGGWEVAGAFRRVGRWEDYGPSLGMSHCANGVVLLAKPQKRV